jgi:hypothetical protein
MLQSDNHVKKKVYIMLNFLHEIDRPILHPYEECSPVSSSYTLNYMYNGSGVPVSSTTIPHEQYTTIYQP